MPDLIAEGIGVEALDSTNDWGNGELKAEGMVELGADRISV